MVQAPAITNSSSPSVTPPILIRWLAKSERLSMSLNGD